jgi:tape measure domain-containing protein
MADRNLVLQLLITAKDNASAALGSVKDRVAGLGTAVSSALNPLRNLGTLLAGAVGIGSAQQIVALADSYIRLTNQLRVATNNQKEYQAALESVTGIAQRSNADLASTASLYGKVAQSAKALGINQQQVADVTEIVAKAMQLSGADANTAAAGIQQLGQALSTGVLRGEEFNSVFEASPKLVEAMAAGLGVATGDMRAMAEAGQLTSDVVVQALLSQKIAIDEVYGKLPQTVGQAMTGLGNAATLFAGKLNEQTGATQGLSSGLKFLAENLDAVAALMGGAFVAAVAKGAYSLQQSAAAALAARAAARDQAIATAAQTEATIAAAQSQVIAAQVAYNRALAEQRVTQAQLAALESLIGMTGAEEAMTAARAQASAAANAATAATQRYTAAHAALMTAQGAGAASAGLFARAMGFLSGPGGLILLVVSAMGALYAAFSKQKPITDNLTAATDQYSTAIERMNAAQLNARLGELDAAIKAQAKAMVDAKAEVDRYQTGHRGLINVLSDSRAGVTILTEKQGVLADATEKLRQLEANRQTTLEALGKEQQNQATRDDKSLIGYTRQATAMDTLNLAIDKRAKQLKAVADAQTGETEALLAKAEAEGNVNAVEQLTLALATQRAIAARTAVELAQGEAVAAGLKATALEKVADAYANSNPKAIENARLARESATLKAEEAKQSEALAAQLEAEVKSRQNGIAATQALADKLAAVREETERYNASLQLQADATQASIEGALALAKAKGDEAAAARIASEAAQEEVASAQQKIASYQEQQTLLDQQINKLYAAANADNDYAKEERAVIEALMAKAKALGLDIAKLEAHLPLQEQEARQAEIMAGPIGELGRLYAANSAEHQRAADASNAYYDTQLNEIDGAIRVAKAKGDEAEANKLLGDRQQILINQADALAAVKRTELADAQNALSVKTMELAADGLLTAADLEQIAVLEAVVVAKANAARQAEDNASAMEKEAAAAKEVSSATKDANDNISKANASFKETEKDLNNMNVAWAKFGDISAVAFGTEGISEYNAIIADTKLAIDNANSSAERLASEGMVAATGNAYALVDQLRTTEGYLHDAANTAADNLVNALADAKEEAMGLRQELQDIATDFSEKILDLTGDEMTQIYVDRAQDLADAETKYAAAGSLATQAYRDATSAISAYYDLKIAKQKEDDAAESVGKIATNMKSLTSATEAATAAAERLAQTNLSNLINQTTQLTNQSETLFNLL